MKTLITAIVFFFFVLSVVKAQTISTFAGNGTGGDAGDGGPAINASMTYPTSGIFDSKGNYYFAERLGHRIRKVSRSGIISTYAGTGIAGYSGDDSAAISAKLDNPIWIAIDGFDNIYIADLNNNRVRKINYIDGIITTIAGDGAAASLGDGGQAILASVSSPVSVCVDDSNSVFILETNKIRKISNGGIIDHFAGSNVTGYGGDGGLADTAKINAQSIFSDKSGNIYVADWGNNRVRRINRQTGIITTVVGNGTPGYSGDGGLADTCKISHPTAGVFDSLNNMYIADVGNNRIRKIAIDGVITTVTGNGIAGFSGDGGLADTAKIYSPEGLAVDSCGNLYIADKQNRRIRKVTFNPNCSITDTTIVDTTDTSTAVLNILHKDNDVHIYPNPAKENVTVSYSSSSAEISVLNMLGQPLLKEKSNGHKAVLNVAGLNNGVYFIVVKDERDNYKRIKFVKE